MLKQMSERAGRNWVLGLTSIASLMIGLDAMVVATALSTIRVQLNASIESLEWTVNAYTLSFAVLLLTGAALGDRFGRRRMFVVGLLIFVAASAACGLAPNIGLLIAARALQGCGAAFVMPLAVTQLSLAFPPQERAKALGFFSGVTGLAILSGPVVGGAISEGLAWQWIFWLNIPIGLIVIPLVIARLPENFGPKAAFDIVGLLLVTGAALGVMWGLVRGNTAGWGSLEVLASLGLGVVLVVAFVFWERLVKAPMVPLRFFRSQSFSAGNTAGFLFFASLYGSTFFLAQFLQTGLGYSPLGTGLRLLPWTVVLFICAPLAGSLVNRLGVRTLLVGGLFCQAVAMAWIGLIARPGLDYTALVPPLMLAGFGAAVLPAGQHAVVGAVTLPEIGKASGVFNTIRQLGAAFGVAILSVVFTGAGNFGTPQAFCDGFGPAMLVSAGLSLVGAIAGLALPGKKAKGVERVQILTGRGATPEPGVKR